MGKKKKKKRNKGRTASKDHSLHSDDYSELLSEELTALSAIFQEDCRTVSESPAQVIIKLRPYSKDTGYENLDVSAHLLVRYVPGYPYKCPKLQITPEKGLSESDADGLLSLLYDQANSNAREGRVMVFNLVEAAQEFLSEIIPSNQPPKLVASFGGGSNGITHSKDVARSCESVHGAKEPYVYGFVDLFGGSEQSWHWNSVVGDSSEITTSVDTCGLSQSKQVYESVEMNFNQKVKVLKGEDNKRALLISSPKLETLEEATEDDNRSLTTGDSSWSHSENIVRDSSEVDKDKKVIYYGEHEEGSGDDHCLYDDQESESSQSFSSASAFNNQASQTERRDLMMVHLLHLACGSKGPLADVLPKIASELYGLGILSDWARDIATKPSSLYNKSFDHIFHQQMVMSEISQFWEPVPDYGGQRSSLQNSRYLSDFEELHSLGHGGFGHVVLCKNKLDGRQYAVKMIRLKDKRLPVNDRILREVATLSRLQHQHIVRYYQAWIETGVAVPLGDNTFGLKTVASSSFTYMGGSSSDVARSEDHLESTYLYIQMEYCPRCLESVDKSLVFVDLVQCLCVLHSIILHMGQRTLRQLFESYNHFDEDLAWHLFRQIVEGLAHIHAQAIIHRDLTPNNIFFDARNDIKIGDFGLAKFLKLEQLDPDLAFPSEGLGISIDGTGQVGTYFYTAPEIEQGWPKIDEKADMYSLGVVFFELFHPFGTAMERHVVLSDLKQKGELPPAWIARFPEQASLLKRLTSSSPSDRPSAVELLQNAFPPRMEYELLDNFLRTMQTSEDTSIYDKVVSSIFDEEMIGSRNNVRHSGALKLHGDDTSIVQHSDIETELRDLVVDATREVFRRHCAKHLEIFPMHLLEECPQSYRNTVKLLSRGGDMIVLPYELRLPFVKWAVVNQKSSFKRYEISSVYRKAIGHSPPNRYLQGDFDIIGGASALTEAEVLKVTMDILVNFYHPDSLDIHLNHGNLLDAIWSWTGIRAEHRQKVAELLSILGSLRPQSSARKSKWVVIRRQLLQELKLAEAAVNRLQTVGLRFCGVADQALPRLRGALPADKSTRRALDELSDLFSYLRVWKIEKHISIDALMPPTENYHRDLFFQIYLRKESPGSPVDGTLLAVGGRYDFILQQMWELEHRSSPPGAVGVCLALETIIQHAFIDIRPFRSEASINVLVCSKGGGGLLEERMELAAELWDANIKAEFVPLPDPSLTEQYEYANDHDIKCLVIITDSGVAQKDSVKVRHLELKKEKEVESEKLVKFLLKALESQFRNPAIWN